MRCVPMICFSAADRSLVREEKSHKDVWGIHGNSAGRGAAGKLVIRDGLNSVPHLPRSGKRNRQ